MRIWNFADEIHFVSLQLDHYYGINGWPRRFCAEIVGCSVSTQKKYESQDWNLTQEEYDYINSLIDYSNREIKKITWNDDQCQYYAGTNQIVKREIQKPSNIVIEPIKDNPLPMKYNPQYNYVYPGTSGLYMLAEIVCPANTPNEQYYLIKIGQSINLKNRINSYKGMNPFAAFVDVLECSKLVLNDMEQHWHRKLEELGGISEAGTEWYVMPKDRYKELIEWGFNCK